MSTAGLSARYLLVVSLLWIAAGWTGRSLSPVDASRLDGGFVLPLKVQEKLADGFRNAAAVALWMSVLSRFGERSPDRRTLQDYRELARELDLVTRWNPRAEHAYFMAAVVLPWSTGSTRWSRPLLERAMQAMPGDWRWPFYRGFNAYWFDHDLQEAARLLAQAASLPNAPPIVLRLAAKMRLEAEDLSSAIAFLEALYERVRTDAVREAVLAQLRELRTEAVLRRLEQALEGVPPEARTRDLVRRLGVPEPLPDGGVVEFLDDGTPVSSASGKRYRLFVPPKHRGRTR